MSQRRILIIGGSTRAAADSVRRAGWRPVCADLFADQDLRKTAEVIRVRNYPRSLPDDVRQVQADGWLYTGALENHPEIIEQMIAENQQCGPLIGTTPEALKLVRDPFWWTGVLSIAAPPVLAVKSQSSPPRPDGSWIQKPLASAGGRIIRTWDQTCASSPMEEPHYFQRRVRGAGVSCLFRLDQGNLSWLGATSEIDSPTLSRPPTPFSYCGSLGPIAGRRDVKVEEVESRSDLFLTDWRRERAIQIAQAIVHRAPGLQGLIGFDFRLCDDELWLMEINPRYTASVEVLELATGQSLLNLASDAKGSLDRDWSPRLVAKQILYATETFRSADLSEHWHGTDPWQVPFLADIPVPNTLIERGWPICTVLASGPDVATATATLEQRIAQARAKIG